MKVMGDNRGAALLLAMLAMVVILTLGMTLLDTGTTEATISANQVRRTQAMYAAEAGLEETLAYLKLNKLKDEDFPLTKNDVSVGLVEPGNLMAKYSIIISKSGEVITIQSTGKVGNASYQLQAAGKYKSGGQYLSQGASVFGSGSGVTSTIGSNVTITGPIAINHEYTTGSNVNIENTSGSTDTEFPEPEDNWYLPPGIQAAPEIIDRNVTNSNRFKTGSNWYQVQGNIDLSNNIFLEYPAPVVIEASGFINIGNNVRLKNVILVTKSSPLVISNNAIVKDCVLYGYNVIVGNNFGETFNEVENTMIYSETNISVNNNAAISTSIMMCKEELTLGQNSEFQGSVICKTIVLENNVQLDYQPEVAPPAIPPSIEEIYVSLSSWGRAVTE